MSKNAPKPYRRLDKADRIAIERGLDKRKPCRQMARELGRSPSTVADEVARNRTVCRGPNKGGRAAKAPEDACPKLLEWPHCCNGCRLRRYHCSRKWRCEYSAARAQALADAELRESRMGVDRGEAEFEHVMGSIRSDVARGLSPEQIALARAAEVGASASTIYRWIGRGYAGMSSLELRRKCGYKPRSHAKPPRQTAHGAARSFAAFMELPGEERAAACEMDTVTGLKSDRRCLLTLYLRAFRFQFALPMPDKTAASTGSALDMLEKAAPRAFRRLFPPAPDRQRRRVRRLRGHRALSARPCGQAVLGLLLRRAPVPAEGRVRAQPRRAAQDTAQGTRDKLRPAHGARLRRADVADELRAQAVFGRHVRHRHAAGGARRRRPRAARRAGGREGRLRGAGHDARGDRRRPTRARRGASGAVAAAGKTE